MIKLYSYFRSSSSYRVRIALNLKNLDYQIVPIHLLKDGGEQFKSEFKKLNAAQRIPAIDIDGAIVSQSVAIMEFLESQFPQPALYPSDPLKKAHCRQLIEIINSDIQPLQNLSVLKKLVIDYGFDESKKEDWIRHWIRLGFNSFESLLSKTSGQFCLDDKPGVADCYLAPQVFNAQRFNLDMNPYPRIRSIYQNCMELEAFQKAAPENQPDTPKED